MTNTAVEQIKISYDDFTHYNEYIYALSLYENLIGQAPLSLNDNKVLKVIYSDYLTKLIAKTRIDLILNRKTEIIKNKKQLEKFNKILTKNPEEIQTFVLSKAQISSIDSFIRNPFNQTTPIPEASTSPTPLEITNEAEDKISVVNALRLSILGDRMLIDCLATTNNIQSVSNVVSNINGYCSYLFYYTRGFLELAKLIRHTAATEHQLLLDEKIKTSEKLKLQLGLRYAILLNDCLWGIINLLTFHFFVGVKTFGYIGNILTIFLLFSDFLISLFNIYLTQKKFNAFEAQLKDKLDANEEITTEEKQKILNQFKDEHDKKMQQLYWSSFQAAMFCLGFVIAFNFLIPGPHLSVFMPPHLFLIGTILITTLQLLDIIVKTILNYKKSKDSDEASYFKQKAMIEILTNILKQITIPGLMVSISLLMTAIPAIPALFFDFALIIIATLLIITISNISKFMILNKEINLLKNKEKTSPSENKEELDIEIKEKELLAKSTKLAIKNNFIYLAGASSVLSIAGIILASSAAALPFIGIPVAILLLSIIIKALSHIKTTTNSPAIVPKTT